MNEVTEDKKTVTKDIIKFAKVVPNELQVEEPLNEEDEERDRQELN